LIQYANETLSLENAKNGIIENTFPKDWLRR